MNVPSSFFGSISVDTFLAEYWQKKPLLVRNAWPDFKSPLLPEEFLALSAREDAFSRLLVKKEGLHQWEVKEGPFNGSVFRKMPESQWTLLIQEVDRLVPAVREMLQVVSFLPNWRIDDVMMSYAANGGGVGAHVDKYDVFLLQGLGRRQWQIETTPREEEELIEGIDVSILASFDPDCDWVLETGDMLYLPPNIPHHGVALGPCMTYSIGCRAPNSHQMLLGLLERVMENGEGSFLQDPDLKKTAHPGLLGDSAVEWMQSLLRDLSENKASLTDLMGRLISESKRWVDADIENGPSFAELAGSGKKLRAASSAQVVYALPSEAQLVLFAGGESYSLDIDQLHVVQQLTCPMGLDLKTAQVDEELLDLLEELWSAGTLIFH